MPNPVVLPARPEASPLRLWLDQWQGRRLGRAGLPNITEDFHFTSPWIRQLTALAAHYAEARRSYALEVTSAQREWLAALPPRWAYAEDQYDRAKARLDELLNGDPPSGVRVGEEHLPAEFIPVRRAREYARDITAAEATLRETEQALGELDARRRVLEQQVEDANQTAESDIERAAHVYRRRWARYVQGLLATHPYPEALRERIPQAVPLLEGEYPVDAPTESEMKA